MNRAGRLLFAGVVVAASPIVGSCAGRSSTSAAVTSLVAVTATPTTVGGDVGFVGLSTASLSTVSPANLRFDGCVLVADTPDERAAGLMERPDVDRYAGMAFVYEDDTTAEFWMYRTVMPLSIAFVDAAGVVIGTSDMEPCEATDPDECQRYGASRPYRVAVEVPAGQLADLGLVAGASTTLGPPC